VHEWKIRPEVVVGDDLDTLLLELELLDENSSDHINEEAYKDNNQHD